MTPAQCAVLAVVDRHGASLVGANTSMSANVVHVSAARALVRQGILTRTLGADGTYVTRTK